MWWCCGKKEGNAIGCKIDSHECEDDDEEVGTERW
tara:strand:- start:346 stop:450 length:105 start_codon:yes stop_codon:yes gene_type:complete